MNILIISSLIPYPLTDGGRMGVFYPIKYLSARGNNVRILCLSEEYDARSVEFLQQYCGVDVILHKKKPTIYGVTSSFFKEIPYEISRFYNQQLMELAGKILKESTYDIIQVEGIHTAFYGCEIKKKFNLPVVMRAHNIHSMNLLRFVPQISNPLLKFYLSREADKVKKYEIMESQKFDRVLTVSGADKDLLRSWDEKIRCDVVEAGVDVEIYSSQTDDEENGTILWMGALQWRPNQDSLVWFIERILPEIIRRKPEVRVKVIGSNPPRRISRIRHPNVDMIGTVDDVKPYLKRAEVCVVPLRIGSGIRLKILEMFSMKKAVVSTAVGCEGLPVNDGKHLLVADTPEQFADAVVSLMNNPALRSELGNAGFQLVKDQYSWENIAEKLEFVYAQIIDEHKRRKL